MTEWIACECPDCTCDRLAPPDDEDRTEDGNAVCDDCYIGEHTEEDDE